MHRKIEIIGNYLNCLTEHLFSNLLVFMFCDNMVEFSDNIIDYEALSLVIS